MLNLKKERIPYISSHCINLVVASRRRESVKSQADPFYLNLPDHLRRSRSRWDLLELLQLGPS